jgi:hypothetical protein
MTSHPNRSLDGLWAGIQLGVFEVIWPTFRWITSIWVKRACPIEVFIQTAELPDEEAWQDCQRLMKELLDTAASSHAAHFSAGYAVRCGLQAPHDEGYVELISDGIFRQIANELAPWRLNKGR